MFDPVSRCNFFMVTSQYHCELHQWAVHFCFYSTWLLDDGFLVVFDQCVMHVKCFLEFTKIYERLNIENLVNRGESFYQPLMPGVVDQLEKQGLHHLIILFLIYKL